MIHPPVRSRRDALYGRAVASLALISTVLLVAAVAFWVWGGAR